MTPLDHQPHPCGGVSPAPLHGWRLWVGMLVLVSIFASLPFVERAANDYRRENAARGE